MPYYCKHWEECHAKLSNILESFHRLVNKESQQLTVIKKASKTLWILRKGIENKLGNIMPL